MTLISLNLLRCILWPRIWLVYLEECSICIWKKKCVIFYCWVGCSINVNQVTLTDTVFQVFYILTDWYNSILQCGCLKQPKLICSQVRRLEVQDEQVGEAFLLDLWWLSSPCVFTQSFLCMCAALAPLPSL